MAKRERGKKSGLPPRVPASRKIPRLSENFATKRVLQALEQARVACKTSSSHPRMRSLFQDFASELELHNQIQEIVVDYCADEAQQIAPKNFRDDIRTFEGALKIFLTKFPKLNDSLTEALDQELNKLDDEATPDTDYIRGRLDTLHEAVKRLAVDEGGPGRDANRAKHLLIRGLACIFEDRTGRSAASSFYIDRTEEGDSAVRGPFADFVKGVNESIPDGYRLLGLETLIRSLE
jgi:hypothetical protein